MSEILERNPQIDRATLDRSRQVEEQLAALGIKLGGYRLEPALGGAASRPFDRQHPGIPSQNDSRWP